MIDILDLNLFYAKAQEDLVSALQLMREGVNNGMGANKVLSILKENGLGYQRKRFLADYSLLKATDMAKTIEGYGKAKAYYDSVRELKDVLGLRNMTEAYDVSRMYNDLNPQTVEDIERIDYLMDSGLGESIFPCRSPPCE